MRLRRFCRSLNWGAAAAVALLSLLTACQRGDPLDARAGAANTLAFQQWRADLAGRLTPDQIAGLDTAVQELRFKIMADGVSGTQAVDAAFEERVTGKTLRQLVEIGLKAKLERLESDRAALATFLAQNSQLVTRAGDTASADYLARKRADQLARVAAIDRELDETRARMQVFGLTPPTPAPRSPIPEQGSGVVEDHPDTMPQILRPSGK